jgi:putative oxidoreductase
MSISENSSPHRGSVRASFLSIRERLGRFPLSIIQLAMRLGVGLVFFNAGLLKLQSFEFAVKLFEDEYKVPVLSPAVAARLAMFNELTFSTLLFLGLGTRFATLPLLGMISVIQIFVYPQAWPDHVLWGSILIFLLTRGPGALSLDHLIEWHLSRRANGHSAKVTRRGEVA